MKWFRVFIAVLFFAALAWSGFFAYQRAQHPSPFPKPTLTSVDPFVVDASILKSRNNTVTITGTGFQKGATIKIFQNAPQNTVIVSSTRITARLALDTLPFGYYDIMVTNPDGQFAILRSGLALRSPDGVVPKSLYTIKRTDHAQAAFASGGEPGQLDAASRIPTATDRDGVMVSAGNRPDDVGYTQDLNGKWVRTNFALTSERDPITGKGRSASKAIKYLDAGINVILTINDQDDSNILTPYGDLATWPKAGFPYADKTVFQKDVADAVEPLLPYLDQGREIWIQSENEVGDASYSSQNGKKDGNMFWRGTTLDYLQTLDALAEEIHGLDSRLKVVLSSFTSVAEDVVIAPPDPQDPQYEQKLISYNYQVLRMGTMLADPNFDVADLHFYGCASDIAAKVQWVQDHMPADKLWVTTEMSGPDYPVCPGAIDWQQDLAGFEQQQAVEVTTRMTACAQSGGSVCLWFSLFDLNDEVPEYNHLGLIEHNTSFPPPPVRLKSAYDAFKNYTALNTNQAPVLSPIGNHVITVGGTLSLSVIASDPDNNPLTYTASNLPSGATFANQVMTWTPGADQAGTYDNVRISVTDGSLTDSEDIAISVNRAPTISPISGQTVASGQTLVFAITASDPDKDRITISATALPPGAVVQDNGDGTGVFSWTPTTDQVVTYTATLVVSDGNASALQDVAISVNGAPLPPTPPPEENPPPQPSPPPTPNDMNTSQTPLGSGGTFLESKWFTAYGSKTRGGFYIASGDVWGDDRDEIIVGTASGLSPQVRIFSNDGTPRGQFYAYQKSFRGGVRVAACDLDGDGRDEIVTAPGPGALPNIKIFDVYGNQVLAKQIWVLDGKSKRGVNIACGDVTGDGKAEIIAGASIGSGQVTVHHANGSRTANFWPFGRTSHNGVQVAVGDVSGDQTKDILVSTENGSPQVRSYTPRGKRLSLTLNPFANNFRGGVSLASGDLNGDGMTFVVVSPGAHAQPTVKTYPASDKKLETEFFSYSKNFTGGVRIASGDVDGDGVDDIITIPASGSTAQVRLYTKNGSQL